MCCFVIRLIICLYTIQGVISRKVDITGSTTGIEGKNGTNLKCSFTKDNGDYLNGVSLYAKNASNMFQQVFLLRVGRPTAYSNLWYYLFGNVTLEQKITDNSTEVQIQINRLLCKHEREYKCVVIFDPGNIPIIMESGVIKITVQVKPSMPDTISMVEVKRVIEDNIEDTSSTTTLDTESITSVQITEVNDDVSPTTSMSITPRDKHNVQSSIVEGDWILFTCAGDVGRPPGNFSWQKFNFDQSTNITYDNSSTEIVYHSENCSFYGTSNITFMMSAKDNNVTVRCSLKTDMLEEELYLETKPIEVLYKVRRPKITKQPDQEMYGKETDTITLTCSSDGNPKPSYVWLRNGSIIHNESVYVISNVTMQDNATYECNVSNTVDCETEMLSVSVDIFTVNEIVTTTTTSTTDSSHTTSKVEETPQKSNTNIIIGVTAAAVVVILIFIGLVCWKRKQRRTKGYENASTGKQTKRSPKAKRLTEPNSSINLEGKVQGDFSKENTYRENMKQNLQYLKQEEDKAKQIKPSEAPVEYAVVEKTKHKYENSGNKDAVIEDPYALEVEGVYDTTHDRRHKPDDNAETYDTTDMKRKSQSANDSEGSTEPAAKSQSYENQSFVDDNNENTKNDNKPLYQNETKETKTSTSF